MDVITGGTSEVPNGPWPLQMHGVNLTKGRSVVPYGPWPLQMYGVNLTPYHHAVLTLS